MSTFLTATTCYLVKKERFLRANRSIHTELWSKRLCGKSIEYNGFPLKNDSDQRRDQTTLPKDWNFLAVVREPISRFISGYINKCIIERQSRTKYAKNCYSCAGNMTCFVGKLYKNAKMFVQAKGKKYLSYEGKHFFPQTWYCAFNQFPYSIVHYGDSALARINMTQQIIAFLKKARVQQISRAFLGIASVALVIFVIVNTPENYMPAMIEMKARSGISELGRLSLEVSAECSLDRDSPCLPPLVNKTSTWVVSHGNKLAFCKIEKVMSTFMTATLCYLNRSKEFLAKGRNIHTDTWFIRFCGGEIEIEGRYNVLPVNYSLAAVIRHPITRFLSGFMDKCVYEQKQSPKLCYNCQRNLSCFLDNFYKKGRRFSNNPFGPDYEQKHFLPQNWYCPFRAQQYFIVPYGDDAFGKVVMKEKFLDVIRAANGTDEQLEYIEKELNYKSPHATKKNDLKNVYLKKLLATPELFKKFLHIFYYDFIFFGIPLPGLEPSNES
ncbi:unnamed protein product, partial [Mesorhabditis belari]|uniref:Carbohydrate sulfotransferase n=1 Tax=Mesorhabditis belari TaxID=2138241 RepID=A0AAF3E8J7_9BILA